MKSALETIKSMPISKIPKQYGWRDRKGIDLKEFNFLHINDCLNKRYSQNCDIFPQDFNTALLYKISNGHLSFKWLHTFIDVDSNTMILGQRYVKQSRLLELLEEPNSDPVRIVQIGKYRIIHDGHHRLAIKSLRKSRVYAKIKTYYFDEKDG